LERKLAAILCADVYGYSRLMGEDEEATVHTLSSHRKIIDGLIEQHRGRFVNSAGDSVLAEFASVVNAVQCAVDTQTALNAQNANLPSDRRMNFRIGVNLGDVMVEGDQIYGDGVNVAARLESLADPGGICVSRTVHENIRNKLPLAFEDLGEQSVKNIAEPVRVFRVLLDGAMPARRMTQRVPRKYWRGGIFSVAGLAIIVVTVVLVQHVSLKPPQAPASIPPPQTLALTLPDKPSIAVLPFINMSGDKDQEYFSDGITDDLITDLSRLPGLFVIARTSTFTYKGKTPSLREVSKQLGVKYVLGGSVQKAANQVRITAQLADATTGAEIWAEHYDRPLRDVFALQDEIVRNIVTTLNLQIALSQKGILIPRTTGNLEAYDDLLRGAEYLTGLTKDGISKARPLFEKAIELDSNYAEAYSLLGEYYFVDWVFAFNPDPNGVKLGLQMEQRAIALDDSLSAAHGIMAVIEASSGQFDQAAIEARRAIALDPNSATAYYALASVLNQQNRAAEALVAIEKAIRLDPRNTVMYMADQGFAYLSLGRYQEAILALDRYLAHYPDVIWAHAWLARADSQIGNDSGAQSEVSEVKRVVALTPDSALAYAALAFALNWVGKPTEALGAVNTSLRLDPKHPVSYLYERGRAYTLLGRGREAIPIIKTYIVRDPYNFWAHSFLAVDYMELGDDRDARAEVAEALKLDPQFTVDTAYPLVGLQHQTLPVQIDRYRADLHKAGMP
jgi:adenylate cyclase